MKTRKIKTKRTLSRKLFGKRIETIKNLSESHLMIKMNDGSVLEVGAESVYVGMGMYIPVLEIFSYKTKELK